MAFALSKYHTKSPLLNTFSSLWNFFFNFCWFCRIALRADSLSCGILSVISKSLFIIVTFLASSIDKLGFFPYTSMYDDLFDILNFFILNAKSTGCIYWFQSIIVSATFAIPSQRVLLNLSTNSFDCG